MALCRRGHLDENPLSAHGVTDQSLLGGPGRVAAAQANGSGLIGRNTAKSLVHIFWHTKNRK
jgi:hypothetical protein